MIFCLIEYASFFRYFMFKFPYIYIDEQRKNPSYNLQENK